MVIDNTNVSNKPSKQQNIPVCGYTGDIFEKDYIEEVLDAEAAVTAREMVESQPKDNVGVEVVETSSVTMIERTKLNDISKE